MMFGEYDIVQTYWLFDLLFRIEQNQKEKKKRNQIQLFSLVSCYRNNRVLCYYTIFRMKGMWNMA